MGLISGSGRSTGGGNGSPLQYACLTSQGQRSLVGYSPWGHKESDTTEGLDSDKTPNKHLCLLRELQEQMNWRLQGVKAVGREAILMTSWERDGKLTSRYHRHISVICSFKLPKVITERLSPLLLKSLPREFYALCIDRLCACVSDTVKKPHAQWKIMPLLNNLSRSWYKAVWSCSSVYTGSLSCSHDIWRI